MKTIENVSLDRANLEAIRDELGKVLTNSSPIVEQQEKDFDTRLCLWPGQSDDGRKWRSRLGKDPMPWEGASDVRIREADAITNEQVDILKNAFANATMQSYAVRQDSLAASSQVNTLISWMLRVHLKERIRPEVELYAQWRQGYGLAVMGVFWEQERRLQMEELNIEEIAGRVAEQSPEAASAFVQEIISQLTDPLREEEAIAALRGLGDGITRAQAQQMRRDLIENARCEYPKVSVVSSLPVWEALRPFVDVFFPVETRDLQKARWIAKAEWLTETELRGRIETDDYDADWVEETLKHKGVTSELSSWYNVERNRLRKSGLSQNDDLVQIFHVYYKGIEERTQAPVLMCTVLSAAAKGCGRHEMAGYAHGKYPFVAGARERISRSMSDSRSVPEIAGPVQSAIKAQFDSRTDATSIANIPPLITPLHRANTRLEFGPGCQHAERKPGELRWMPVPTAHLGSSVEVEAAARAHLDRYFGRFSSTVPPLVSQARAANLVEDFLGELREVVKQTVQLAQQYLPEMVIERVTGGKRVPFRISRADIQGEFDIAFSYDTRNLDTELIAEKLRLVKEVLALDTFGITDRAKLVSRAMSWIDPTLAEELVGDPQAAAQDEVEDEKRNFSLIMSGVEPAMHESGQNFALRLRTLESLIQQNPYAAKDIQDREDRLAITENRLKHLRFQVQQQQNAQTGRLGTQQLDGAAQ